MTATITHTKVSAVADGADTSLVRPVDWNATHTVDATTLPGYEFDYAQATVSVTVTATSEATATTVVTGNAVTYDGSTIIEIEFFAVYTYIATNTSGNGMSLYLYDGSSSIGNIGYRNNPTTTNQYQGPAVAMRRITPSAAAHTYSIRASKDAGGVTTVIVGAGAGGVGNDPPAFIRITRV